MLAGAARDVTAVPVCVRLFGGVRVERDDEQVAPPPGAPSALLRMVAACGAVHLEELSEALWPESPAGAGRARLRNVLSRLRAGCGDVVVRVGESLAVAENVVVDLAVFEAHARRALALPAGDPERSRAAKAALACYDGELLPEDVYREWAVEPRERARGYRLALLDAVAEDAASAGDVNGAIRRWEEATRLEPYDEVRYVAMARLLVQHARWGAAHGVLERADAALAALGLPASPALQEVRRVLTSGEAGW